jgi:hypothetical protein
MAEQLRGPFEKFVNSPYYSELELCGGVVTVPFFEVPPLASDALLTALHPPLLENVNWVIRWVHELFKRPSLLRHPKNGSFKMTVTLTTVRGMTITPLLRYTHHNNLA